MPVAVIQEWAEGGPDTRNYDAINERMGVRDDLPEGLIVHTAGVTASGGFRVVDVWESREAWDRFNDERLGPAVREVIGGLDPHPPPPRTEIYELYNVLRP
ncbi:MAG TPA: hypothetical protein VK904_03420 [Miltoncostaeaceae bacterium]|nr:hypothetical protein [Miltoncostaeaceae bacterium]